MSKRMYFAIAAGGLLTLGLSGSAFAFHDGGVAHCDGCHSMHNSAENLVGHMEDVLDVDGNPVLNPDGSTQQVRVGSANGKLLKGSDPSSTCLNCHAGSGRYHIMSSDGSNTTEGGDFYWVKTDYTYSPRPGVNRTSAAENHGHSIIASDYGLVADPTNTAAPGGTYPAASLGCNSCHNPHGQVNGGTANGTAPIASSGSYGADPAADLSTTVGNYRLLGDDQYVAPGGLAFTANAPIARANSYDGATTDYGMGMSEWCGNCHGDFTGANNKHKAANDAALTAAITTNYNNYRATGDWANINATNSYDALVPFERQEGTRSALHDGTTGPVQGGPDGINDNVMCLTCHRAHASANENAGRWAFNVELLADSPALVSPDLAAGAAIYYKDGGVIDVVTEYGEYQRSLCNKCHVWD